MTDPGSSPALPRVPLTGDERAAVSGHVFLDDALAHGLEAWIERNYRDRLAPNDLADPALVNESRRALDELTQLLGLPPVYRFQGAGA